MKRIFITLATIGLLSAGSIHKAHAGVKDGGSVTVSYAVENEFQSTFSGAKDVVWTINSNCQKATFTLNNVKMTAFYDLQGSYLGVTREVKYDEIAAKAKETIADKYKDYSVKQVIKYEALNADVNFEETTYFVDLKNDSKELLVRVTPSSNVYFFQEVK